ncbi:uncharacterized protein LOC126979816 [Leptidea sinapis]|uniref:uncharacterized protein LOC126979816 n=1 Tax=Leptidea sinapis TaxID=189913 RepID=UPI00213528C1|nr:uncharacterized protein LOC126979816 [Leptidea sinapis]
MPKCNKIKNPCKICLAPVTQKNGLQCQGFCQTWMHYGCLDFTPGKIKDIKAGVIQVTCPCPDCSSPYPREIRTDESFSCTNLECPANLAPRCENEKCPSNKELEMKERYASAGVPLDKCEAETCKKHNQRLDSPISTTKINQMSRKSIESVLCTSTGCTPQKAPGSTVTGDCVGVTKSMPSLSVLEQMCNTVGQLTEQIHDLMNQMKYAVQEKDCGMSSNISNSAGKRSPNPCYCPGNRRN